MDFLNKIAPYLLVAIVFIFIYYMYVRPQKAIGRRTQERIAALEPGDEVVTISGVFARVEETADDYLILKVIPGETLIKVKPQAIAVFPDDIKNQKAE